MSSEPTSTSSESTALTVESEAERRVERAKARLMTHLAALDHRARHLGRLTLWVAGAVLLGFAGAAAAAAMLGSRKTNPRRSYHDADAPRGRRGVGTALVAAALGLFSQRARSYGR